MPMIPRSRYCCRVIRRRRRGGCGRMFVMTAMPGQRWRLQRGMLACRSVVAGMKEARSGRLGAYVRDDRNAGSALAPAVWFAYSPDRKGIHPQTHLACFSGVLQADAYAGFNELYRNGGITEAAC